MHDIAYKRLPVQDIEFNVRPTPVNFSATTWYALLEALQSARHSDGAAANEYYYALIDTCGTSMQGFGGMSLVPGAVQNEASQRVSAGEWRNDKRDFS